jgi:hypothetical protein
LPFALAGFLCLIVAVVYAFRAYKSHQTALLSGLFLVSSQIFVLHARQARYYPLLMLGQAVIFLGLWLGLSKKLKSGAALISAALLVQFYSNYVAAVGNVVSLWLCLVLFWRGEASMRKMVAICTLVFSALSLPWAVYAKIWTQGGTVPGEIFFQKLFHYVLDINFWIFPLAFAIVWAAAAGYEKIRRTRVLIEPKHKTKKERKIFLAKALAEDRAPVEARKIEKFIWLSLPVHLALLSAASRPPFQRYMCFLAIGLGVISSDVLRRRMKSHALRVVLCGLFFFTNYPHVLPLWPLKNGITPEPVFFSLASEISHEYRDRLDDVIQYFKTNARKSDSVYSFDAEFGFIFYTGMKVIDGNLRGGRIYPPLPDWIFGDTASGVFHFSIRLEEGISHMYEEIKITVLDSKHASAIPEPKMHERFTPTSRTVFPVYKLKKRGI